MGSGVFSLITALFLISVIFMLITSPKCYLLTGKAEAVLLIQIFACPLQYSKQGMHWPLLLGSPT
jgi:hypothetical protein